MIVALAMMRMIATTAIQTAMNIFLINIMHKILLFFIEFLLRCFGIFLH
jgi:hypothetical protein